MTPRNTEILTAQNREQADFFDPNDETIPSRGYTNGSLNQDGKAMAAVKALPPGMVSSALFEQEFVIERAAPFSRPYGIIETLRNWWNNPQPVLFGLFHRRGSFAGVMHLVNSDLEALELALYAMRVEVEVLARAYQKELANQRAYEIQQDQGEQFRRLFGEHKELRKFLNARFGVELEQAEMEKKPLVALVIELLSRG